MIKIECNKMSELLFVYSLIRTGELNFSESWVQKFKSLNIPTSQDILYTHAEDFIDDVELQKKSEED